MSVTSGRRRVDLVLPGAVPVAELLPELARSVGMLDPATLHGGYHAVTADGRKLALNAGLTVQGVDDGSIVMVVAGVDSPAPRVYDDVVEAMTDVVERDLHPWEPAAGRRTALTAAALLLALGAGALLLQRDSTLAVAASVVVAIALCASAVVLSRVQDEGPTAVVVGWLGAAYAVVAGLMSAPAGAPDFAAPLAAAGGGALLAGLFCAVGLGPGRILMFPPVALGAIGLAVGSLVRALDLTPVDAAAVLVAVLAVVVLVGSIFPWLALGATATKVDPLYSPADITAEPGRVEAHRVGADARTAHEILLAITGTVGALIVLVAPVAAGLGVAGTLLAVDVCLIVLLRTRQYRTGSQVAVGMGSGILGLAVTAVAVLLGHPDWRPTLAVVLAGAGAVLLAATFAPSVPSVRRGRLGDVLETITLVALVPLVVLATGLFDKVAG